MNVDPTMAPAYQGMDMVRSRLHNFPAGVNAALLMQKIEFDTFIENQSYNFNNYVRFNFSTLLAPPVYYQTFTIPEDYYYHLEEVHVWLPYRYYQNNPAPIRMKLWQVSGQRELSNNFIGAHILCTPDSNIELNTTPDVNAHLRHTIRWNHLFLPNDNIKIGLEMVNPADIVKITHADVVTRGIRIPVQERLPQTR